MLMADFSTFELEVLEEILYSPLKISIKKLERSLETSEESLLLILKKLESGGLLSIQGDTLFVDKEMRKYFEFQLSRFSPEFKPDMEFVQGILKKVPIHILPVWYSVPRTTNNIFESIVEKHLLTPQVYQRYLHELQFSNPIIPEIIQDLFKAPEFKISSSDLIAKYNLSRREFEEILLLLEFNFVCCLVYEKQDDHWSESVSFFQEWADYLQFLKETQTPTLPLEQVSPTHSSDFVFLDEMASILSSLKTSPFPWDAKALKEEKEPPSLETLAIQKLLHLKLIELRGSQLFLLPEGEGFLQMDREKRAVYLYRHPENQIASLSLDPSLERAIREAEKAIKRVLHGHWVLFDAFLKGVTVALSPDSLVTLVRTGKHWKYCLPSYNEKEKNLLKATIFEYLFEMGIVKVGTYQGQPCFAVTAFGRSFFED